MKYAFVLLLILIQTFSHAPILSAQDSSDVSFVSSYQYQRWGMVEDFVVKDSIACLTGEEFLLKIIDIRSPGRFPLIGSFDLENFPPEGKYIFINEESIVFICSVRALYIFDISDINNIELISETDISIFGICLVNNLLISERGNNVEFIDVSDIRNPVLAAELHVDGFRNVWASDASEDRLYIGCEEDHNGYWLDIFDISDLDNIEHIERIDFQERIRRISVDEELCFCRCESEIVYFETEDIDQRYNWNPARISGLRGLFHVGRVAYIQGISVSGEGNLIKVDFSDLENPEAVQVNCDPFLMAMSWEYKIQNDKLYYGVGNLFSAQDISNPENPFIHGFANFPGRASNLILSEDRAIVDYQNGLSILDIGNLDQIQEYSLDHRLSPRQFRDASLSLSLINQDTIAFSNRVSGYNICGINDSMSLELIGRMDIPEGTHTTESVCADGIAYFTSCNGLHIVDISDRTNPAQMGFFQSANYQSHLDVDNRVAGFRTNHGFQLIDVSDPENPDLFYECDTIDGIREIDIDHEMLYIRIWNSWYRLFDISDPTQPQLLGRIVSRPFDAEMHNLSFSDDGSFGFVANGIGGIRVFELASNPGWPQETGFYETDDAWAVQFRDGFAYVADNSNFSVYDCRIALDIPIVNVVLPGEIRLNAPYPNPFNSQTTVSFGLPIASHVSIMIYDLSGRRLQNLLNAEFARGNHSVIWNAEHNPAGVYFIGLEAGDSHSVQKINLIR
ncbi:MAG: T9SS type A sorting domain-containing protein [Calditrichaeota bacterium]|nr:T9SS type A sorting domain-containing protein [Calditrichota bacterium]